jgi:hypothetical protein
VSDGSAPRAQIIDQAFGFGIAPRTSTDWCTSCQTSYALARVSGAFFLPLRGDLALASSSLHGHVKLSARRGIFGARQRPRSILVASALHM